MAFDGIMLHGYALKVRRPKDYVPFSIAPAEVAPGAPKPALPAGAIVATNVPDSPHKIFIGGLPAHLNEEQVKDLLMTFGPLKAFNLVKDTTTGLSKGFAFCEYLDESVTDRACSGLNGMKLGDKQLLVQRAIIGAKNPAPQPIAPQPTLLTGPLTASPANILNLAIPAVTILATLAVSPQASQPTRVLQLLNVATLEEVKDEDEYAALLEDLRGECEKVGPVRTVTVPRPIFQQESRSFYEDGDGESNGRKEDNAKQCPIAKAYVEFEKQEDCLKALQLLAGRRYGDHIVVTCLYSQDMYLAHILF